MEQEKARLSRNGQAHFIGQFETATAFESLLSQEDLNMGQEFVLIVGRKSLEQGKAPRKNRSPL
jgi:hypothetical protein